MPKLKKTKRAEFLGNLAENLRICCKVRGTEKISAVMGVSVNTVYSRIKTPSGITADELFRIAEYIGVEVENLVKPLKILSGKEM
ncbi:MAG: hypothetical protein NC177_14245 [Ruminococcus flavefaciens]|nr:hypothetical protein [Ruminococcus flavefaciens]